MRKRNVIIRGFSTSEIWQRARGDFGSWYAVYDSIIKPYAGKMLQCDIDKAGNLVYGGVRIPEEVVFCDEDLARCNVIWVDDDNG